MINGALEATQTKFQNNLSVSSKKITLKDCSVNLLMVRKNYEGPQIVDLRGSHVKGYIFFESREGEIWVSDDSQISEAQVFGAKILKK